MTNFLWTATFSSLVWGQKRILLVSSLETLDGNKRRNILLDPLSRCFENSERRQSRKQTFSSWKVTDFCAVFKNPMQLDVLLPRTNTRVLNGCQFDVLERFVSLILRGFRRFLNGNLWNYWTKWSTSKVAHESMAAFSIMHCVHTVFVLMTVMHCDLNCCVQMYSCEFQCSLFTLCQLYTKILDFWQCDSECLPAKQCGNVHTIVQPCLLRAQTQQEISEEIVLTCRPPPQKEDFDAMRTFQPSQFDVVRCSK